MCALFAAFVDEVLSTSHNDTTHELAISCDGDNLFVHFRGFIPCVLFDRSVSVRIPNAMGAVHVHTDMQVDEAAANIF